MRTHVTHGLAVLAALAVAACSNRYPQQVNDPINPEPQPQTPITSPEPQAFGPGHEPEPRDPITDPSRQGSTFGEPQPQEPITSPQPQEPFYGPLQVEPGERATERAKAKQALSSDGEVLSVAMAINEGEIQMAELAKRKAQSKDVKQLATGIANDHQQSNTKIRDVQGKTKIDLKSNDVTAEIQNKASEKMGVLRGKTGSEFDRYYVESQVRLHEHALDVIDNRLMPGVQNGQVKSAMSDLRGSVADHLAKSESLLKKLDPSTAAALDEGDTSKAKGDTSKAKDD